MTVERATGRELAAVRGIDALVLGSAERGGTLAGALGAGHLQVARVGETVVGFAVFEPSFFGRWFIGLLVVHPDHRGQGVATAFVRRCEAECPAKELFTSTNESNATMQRLLDGIGYERSGYVENLDSLDPELIYSKPLSKAGEASSVGLKQVPRGTFPGGDLRPSSDAGRPGGGW